MFVNGSWGGGVSSLDWVSGTCRGFKFLPMLFSDLNDLRMMTCLFVFPNRLNAGARGGGKDIFYWEIQYCYLLSRPDGNQIAIHGSLLSNLGLILNQIPSIFVKYSTHGPYYLGDSVPERITVDIFGISHL